MAPLNIKLLKWKDTVLAQIIKLVEDAQGPAPIAKTDISGYFVSLYGLRYYFSLSLVYKGEGGACLTIFISVLV